MFFFFCRVIGIWFMAATVVATVVDGMKSIAAGRIIVTSLNQVWTSLSPTSLAATQAYLTKAAPRLWDPFALAVLQFPAWGVFVVLGAIFVFLGTRRRRTVIYVS